MGSNSGKSDLTVVAISKGNHSERLLQLPEHSSPGKEGCSSETTRERVVASGELLYIHHGPRCNAPPKGIFSDPLGRTHFHQTHLLTVPRP